MQLVNEVQQGHGEDCVELESKTGIWGFLNLCLKGQ